MEPAGSERIVLAVVTRPHGLRGAVRAKVFNPETGYLGSGAKVDVGKAGTARRLRVREATPARETWIVHFEGVDTVEAAEALRGAELSVRRDELPPPGDGEFYHADLVGCVVVDLAGAALGTVRAVAAYPTVDALVVETPRGEVEIPVVDGVVTEIDVAARRVVVDAATLEDG